MPPAKDSMQQLARPLLLRDKQHIQNIKFDMKIRKQFDLHKVLDPFTLLEVNQALNEIPNGELLKLTYAGEKIPDKLFKIIPEKVFKIVSREVSDNPKHCTILIKRRNIAPVDLNDSTGGCDCS